MSSSSIRLFIRIVLLFHAIGHLMGVMPALRLFGAGTGSGPDWVQNWSSDSPFLQGILSESGMRILCGVLYACSFFLFLVTAFSMAGWIQLGTSWTRWGIIASILSLVTVVLFWNGLILLFPHKIGALFINIAFLVLVLFFKTQALNLLES